tara:strand:+ start:15637 stop:15930 length:294 start_codon:yes stop_codon:yes gene_type:complete
MGYREEQEILNQEVKVDYPGGGSQKRCKMKDVISGSRVSTSRGEYKFKNSSQSKAKNAVKNIARLQERFAKDMENAQEELMEAYINILQTADITVKR